jgi:hypothetical protein
MWKRCPRRWLVEYYFGMLPADPNPASTRDQGLRWHTAMEAHYGPAHLDPGFVLDVLYGMAIEQHPESERDLQAAHEMAKIMAEGYLETVAAEGWDARLKVVEPEAEVRIDLPGWEGIVQLRAKLDQVYYNEDDGTYGFLDHKSAANFEREEMIRSDPQIRLYSLIAWLATQGTVPQIGAAPEIIPGRPLVAGGIIRTARRVKRTAKARPPFYLNTPFRHPPELLAATLLSTQQVVGEIMNARRQLDAAGSLPEQLHFIQLTATRPVPIIRDCANMCPLASGQCQLMDESLGWIDALWKSGKFVSGDPYARYTRGGLQEIQAYLATHAPTDGTNG